MIIDEKQILEFIRVLSAHGLQQNDNIIVQPQCSSKYGVVKNKIIKQKLVKFQNLKQVLTRDFVNIRTTVVYMTPDSKSNRTRKNHN